LLQTVETFRHEALLYAGEVDFLTGTLPDEREGVATNSLRHGGGRGTLRIWRDAGPVVRLHLYVG
jgi:hypothetical protein